MSSSPPSVSKCRVLKECIAKIEQQIIALHTLPDKKSEIIHLGNKLRKLEQTLVEEKRRLEEEKQTLEKEKQTLEEEKRKFEDAIRTISRRSRAKKIQRNFRSQWQPKVRAQRWLGELSFEHCGILRVKHFHNSPFTISIKKIKGEVVDGVSTSIRYSHICSPTLAFHDFCLR